MSLRKIIFLAITGIATLILAIVIISLSNKTEKNISAPKDLKIWISEGTTDDYASIVEGFKLYAPEFKNTNIVFEKKTTDPIRYRTLLLSMMSDDMSPDIFMIGAGEDAILQTRIEPIPEEFIDIGYFEKEYDDVFLPLISSTGTKESIKRSLLGVPLGFETMGIFYNKNLIREVPKTWDELDILYRNGILDGIFVSNLGLGPRYTPNTSDIISLFLRLDGTTDITNTANTSEGAISRYIAYGGLGAAETDSENSDFYTPAMNLQSQRNELEASKSTTLDMFVEGRIGMIFGFPSLISELEKSDKRVGSSKSVAGVILTSKIPLIDISEGRKNIVRYNYFAISKATKNPQASAKFLQYLMTADAQRKFLEKNPELIAAQRSFWTAQKNGKISDIFNRAGIESFIPDIDEELIVFNYGLKAEFNEFLSEYLDRNDIMDISNIIELLSSEISCSISPYNSSITITEDCDKK